MREYVKQNPNNHLGIDNSLIDDVSNMRELSLTSQPRLLIFVSTSMPKSLLFDYFKEASKYNGILVFKGLPNGSFKELTKLILSFEEEVKNSTIRLSKDTKTQIAASIIDDEAFKKYGVISVPTIVLSKEEECFEGMSCSTTYDKVNGNVGVKAALEEFKNSGELANSASCLLREKTQDAGEKKHKMQARKVRGINEQF